MAALTGSLAPGLLLAAPSLEDPNFAQSVVLLGEHDEESALGWVLNGKSLVPVAQLLRDAGLPTPDEATARSPSFASMVRVGGPVMPGSVWLLYEKSATLATYPVQYQLGPDHAMTCTTEAFEALARGEGPWSFRLLLGFSGWGPGQLEQEIQAGAWLPASLEAEFLLRSDVDTLWNAAYQASVGQPPAAFTITGPRGSA